MKTKFKVEDGKLIKVEDEELEEMSTVSGGGIVGHGASVGRRNKQNKTIPKIIYKQNQSL